ncbi:MAG: hypothetical protein L0Z70_14540 [Chloroflexi bacterium]|nr:hypothetical protein [Chloroflexota bacterium]
MTRLEVLLDPSHLGPPPAGLLDRLPERVLFILSTSRTGTKSLAEGLDGGEVRAVHQPPHSRLLTVAGNYALHGWLPYPWLARLVYRLRLPQIASAGRPYYIQVFSLDILPAKIVSQAYAPTHVLHILRDARTFVPSYLNWMRTRKRSMIANRWVYGWHPSGYFTGEFSWGEWRRMDEFQRVCWHWVYKNTLIERLFSQDSRYQRVYFEGLFSAGGEAILRTILEKAGIPYVARYGEALKSGKNASRKEYIGRFETWDERRKGQLMEICGGKLQEWGYLE